MLLLFFCLVEEIKHLAEALMKCKSYKDRQQSLIESLDTLSFHYPDIYSLLFKEMKKRELEFNDPNKITVWPNSSNSNLYITKLHEALMLVKSNNTMAKEEYLDIIKQMLCQTIKNGSNIELVMKICRLLEKSPHLKTIHEFVLFLFLIHYSYLF